MTTPGIKESKKKRLGRASNSNLAAVTELLSKMSADLERMADAPLPNAREARILAKGLDVLLKAQGDLRQWLSGRRDGNWISALIKVLAEPSTPRVFRTAQIVDFIRKHEPGISARTSGRVLSEMEEAGALIRVARGFYANERASPPVVAWEFADRIRMGAVISLQSVLGEAGVLNNPTDVAVAVVPVYSKRQQSFEAVRWSNGTRFEFYLLDEKFFRTGLPAWNDVFQDNREYPIARVEAALLHWLFLASAKRSLLPPPPLDVDLSELDLKVLKRLAHSWNLMNELTAYRSRVAEYEAAQERYEAGLEPLESARPKVTDSGLKARARLVEKARRLRKA